MLDHIHSFSKLEFDKVVNHIQRYALSDLGREHLVNLIPSSNLSEIKRNLALVTEMKKLLEGDEYPPLEHLYDIRPSLQKSSIENFVLTPEELLQIALVIETSGKLHGYFFKRKAAYPCLGEITGSLHVEKVLTYNIFQAIDEDGTVRDSASKELSSIRRQIVETRSSLRKSLESILRSVVGKDWIQEEIITTREGRMVIPVKVEHKNRVPGFIHSSSSSGATVFVEPTVTLELNNEIRTLEFHEQREVEKILRELSRQVRENRERILGNVHVVGVIDFIQAKAKYSIEILGSEPVLNDRHAIRIFGGYHPILLQKHRRDDVVPLTIALDENIRTIIITGPNAGGKSVAMKTVGLLCLLAQAGCHIPASSESEIDPFDDVFIEMGDEQSIENDLSSFSSHLGNLKYILQNASARSMVLIDEICSGTDPTEGASLAAAIIEQLNKTASLTIVTTHHGSLKTFAYENPSVKNAAMEFDQSSLRPTYQFKVGIPGSSYAIEMAQRIDLPVGIIERSKQLKGSQANKLEDLILDLEHQSQKLKSSLADVKSKDENLHQLMKAYNNKIRLVEGEVKQIRLNALDEAQNITQTANATIERVVRNIREHSAQSHIVKSAQKEIQQLQEINENLQHTLQPLEHIQGNLPIGTVVRLKDTDTTGEIVSQLDDSNYLILVGGLKVKVDTNKLVLTSTQLPKHRKEEKVEHITSEIKHDVDLRGMYGDEAITAIEKALDDAILHGLHRIDIIHGKGTGALRKRVTEYLKNSSVIKSYRLGEWNEGGSGVTVVELS